MPEFNETPESDATVEDNSLRPPTPSTPKKKRQTNSTSGKTAKGRSPNFKAPSKNQPKKSPTKAAPSQSTGQQNFQAKFPRHSFSKALRIPRAILDQNAGKSCSNNEAVSFLGFKLNGELRMEMSSALKYGFLLRPSPNQVALSDLARKILRPQNPQDYVNGLREAVLKAPDIADVYKHYRGENLPAQQFFDNALTDTFRIPPSNLSEFKSIFIEDLKDAELLEQHNDTWRVLDVSGENFGNFKNTDTAKKTVRLSIESDDSCFVIMPFAPPLGNHYTQIFEPAIEKAGLRPVRADDEIFATGKIIDQVWRGITSAKVLVAELTNRNPNVFYELGLAHALRKPVVLISSNEGDVPFDVRHIRVIYYDVNDPFWGPKLLEKVAENIISAIKNPEEAIFKDPS